MKCPFFKHINDIVLKYVSYHDLAVAVTDKHNIWMIRMTIYSSNRRKIDWFTHLPSYLHFHSIIYHNLSITPIILLFLDLLLFKWASHMSISRIPTTKIAIVYFLLSFHFVFGYFNLFYQCRSFFRLFEIELPNFAYSILFSSSTKYR